MTITDHKPSPTLAFSENQFDVAPRIRARDLVAWAGRIAADTDPLRPVALSSQERLLVAMALPNLEDAPRHMVAFVSELHNAELADKIDHRDPDYVHPDTYRESADTLAAEAVDADLKAGCRGDRLTLVPDLDMPTAGVRS